MNREQKSFIPEQPKIRAASGIQNEILWELDLATDEIWWGTVAEKLFADLPLSTDAWIQRIHTDDRPLVQQALTDLRLGKQPSTELQYRLTTGTFVTHSLQSISRNNEVVRIIGKLSFLDSAASPLIRNSEVVHQFIHSPESAFNNASIGIIISNLEGTLEFVNRAFCELTGYTEEELYGRAFNDITNPAEISTSQELYKKLYWREILSGQIQKRYIRKDGSLKWVNLHATLIDDEAGEPKGFISVVNDISEEVQLREEQNKLLALVENSVEFMAITSIQGELVYINPAGRILLGIQEEANIPNLKLSDFYFPDEHSHTIIHQFLHHGSWKGTVIIKHFQTKELIPVFSSVVQIKHPTSGHVIAHGYTLRDMHQEISAQQVLLDGQSKFRQLVMQAPIAIGLLKGTDLVIETANDEILRLWGKTDVIVGKPLIEAMPELKGQGFQELLRDVYNTGNPFYGNEIMVLLFKNNQLVASYFNFVYAPIKETSGEISGVMVVATEVTDQVRAKKQLEVSEERFRSFILNSPIPIAIYEGREMRIKIVNDALLRTWDRDISVIGKTFREVLPELEGQPFFDLLDQVYTTGIPYNAIGERVDLFVNGMLQTFYFNFTYKALRDANNNVYGVMNTATDVTPIIHAQEKLKETESELRSAVELAELGTWSYNLQTKEFIFSRRVEQWYGIDSHTNSFEDFIRAIYPEDRPRVVDLLLHSSQQHREHSYSIEYRVRHLKSGKERIIQANGKTSVDVDGNPVIQTGTVRDVTVQKQTEKELERLVIIRTEELQKTNELLQHSNQELEQYAYVASHDLQEPLRKIRMFAGMIQDSKELPESIKNPVSKVIHSSERMTMLIKDLLEFSRLLKTDSVFKSQDLNTIVDNVIMDFELSIQEKQAVIHIDPLPTIDAVPLQMNQLFYNLISNALKFVKPTGQPAIAIRSHALSDQEKASYDLPRNESVYYKIVVSDNGIGFKQQYNEQIFEVFKRLHTRDSYPGSGIGLALCRRIMQNHRGILYAQSQENVGTEFHLIFPERQNW